MRKTFIRFYTIADFEEEEIWLREQQRAGWKLVKLVPPCFYTFESCEPADVIYRLDFKNNTQTRDYLQMLSDFGWEYAGSCVGWLYFRKPAAAEDTPEDRELFSDDASRAEMTEKIVKTRMFPLIGIFLCCVVPNLLRSLDSRFTGWGWAVITGIFAVLFVIYVVLLLHCGLKLRKIRARYRT